MRMAIVTPLANEEEIVPEFLSRVMAQISQRDRVLCIVDNASKDGTRSAVEKFSAEVDTRAICIWAPENRCVVDAYFRGYRAALALGAEWILEMDGGFSHLPEEIPRFVEAMGNGAEFAAGSRFMRGSNYHSSRLGRWLTSRGGTILANLMLGTRMKDMTSGFECFSRPALEAVLATGVRSKAHFFQTEIRYMMHQFKWVEVPISYSCPSKSLGGDSIQDALKCLWALRRQRANRK